MAEDARRTVGSDAGRARPPGARGATADPTWSGQALALRRRVTARCNDADDLPGTMRAVLAELVAHTDWPVGHTQVRGYDGEALTATGWWVADPDAPDHAALRAATSSALAAADPVRRALAGELICGAPAGDRGAAAVAAGLGQVVAVPVRSQQRVVAVLELHGPAGAALHDDLRALLVDLGIEAGRVFERLRWHTELYGAAAAERQLLRLAAHELRTPLVAIEGYADLLQDEPDAAERAAHATTIRRHAQRLLDLVTKVLVAGLPDDVRLQGRPTAVPVLALVAAVAEDLALPVTLAGDGALRWWVDHDHATAIVHQLLDNARAYGRAPFDVEVDADGATVTLRVRDHGRGVEPSLVPEVFRAYRRGTGSGSGAGLGLTIARELADRAGGQVWYEPGQPDGATFAVRLPAARP